MKSSTPWCISIGFGYQLDIPSRQEAKQRRVKKTSPQKFQCGQKLRKGFRETAMGGSQSVFSEQELSDYQVSFAYTKLSNIRKIEKGGHIFCLKIHDKLDLTLLFLARLNERSCILFSYKISLSYDVFIFFFSLK